MITKQPNEADILNLFSEFGFCRPSFGSSQNDLGLMIHAEIVGMDDLLTPEVDEECNLRVTVGDKPTTMFSCHLDTVDGAQLNNVDKVFLYGDGILSLDPQWVKKHKGKGAMCLGADDTTGIIIMLYLIRNKVPGVYIFHTNEESGGIGSDYIAKNNSNDPWFTRLNRAIAFDRMGTTDCIIDQCGPTASPTCGNAISSALGVASNGKLKYKLADGIFTDTANYAHLIPECINLSVGYERQHTIHETQNIPFLVDFIKAAIKVDWEALPTTRDPDAMDYQQGVSQDITDLKEVLAEVSHHELAEALYYVARIDADYLSDILEDD